MMAWGRWLPISVIQTNLTNTQNDPFNFEKAVADSHPQSGKITLIRPGF